MFFEDVEMLRSVSRATADGDVLVTAHTATQSETDVDRDSRR